MLCEFGSPECVSYPAHREPKTILRGGGNTRNRMSLVEEETTVYGIGVLTSGRTLHFNVLINVEERELSVVPWMSMQRLCGDDTLAWATGTRVGTSDHATILFCIECGCVLGFCTLIHCICG